jgi:hypothetical protein
VKSSNILTHGYCLDGLISASLFTIWLDLSGERSNRRYRTCGYSPKLKTLPSAWFDADVNALLDFRFADHPKLTHYIDHHATAFRDAAEQAAALESAASGQRVVHFDPEAKSCAGLIVRAARQHGLEIVHEELITLADQVDSASFANAEEPFFARSPGLQLADVAERHADTSFVARMCPLLIERSLVEIAKLPEIVDKANAIALNKTRFLAAIKATGQLRGEVAVVDLTTAKGVSVAGKFATYLAFPRCRYSATLLRTQEQLKLGIGHNPFAEMPRKHDIGALCRRYGGGGHRAVGAINFVARDLDNARRVLSEVAALLAQEPGPESA